MISFGSIYAISLVCRLILLFFPFQKFSFVTASMCLGTKKEGYVLYSGTESEVTRPHGDQNIAVLASLTPVLS